MEVKTLLPSDSDFSMNRYDEISGPGASHPVVMTMRLKRCMNRHFPIRLVAILAALALSACKEATQFTVQAGFKEVAHRLQEELPSVPAWKHLQVRHDYTDRIGFSYLDESQGESMHRVTIVVSGRNSFETQVAIRGERVLQDAGRNSYVRDPEFEQRLQQKLFPALHPG